MATKTEKMKASRSKIVKSRSSREIEAAYERAKAKSDEIDKRLADEKKKKMAECRDKAKSNRRKALEAVEVIVPDSENQKLSKSSNETVSKKEAGSSNKMGCLDAAAEILKARKVPMRCKDLIEAMAEEGLWVSPHGLTPHATLYAAIHREINMMGEDSRFQKVSRGEFSATGK